MHFFFNILFPQGAYPNWYYIALSLHLRELGSEHEGQVVDCREEGQISNLFLEVAKHRSNSRNVPAEEHLDVHYSFLQEPRRVHL